jgi:acyl-CoA thioesterase
MPPNHGESAIDATLGVSEFDADTSVAPAPGGWALTLSDRWDIVDRPNGGYLLASVVRAMAADIGRPDPLTVTGHYLRPAAAGPALVEVEVVRTGRRLATAGARLVQDGRERLRVLATFGDLTASTGPDLVTAVAPQLPPPEECVPLADRRPEGMADTPRIHARFDMRLDPSVGWPTGARSGAARIAGWTRFADGRPPDVWSLLLFADAFPPAVFDAVPSGWVPTVELTVHLRARPEPGWLRAEFRTRVLRNGMLEEDGELWDESGQMVAMSRQLALLLPEWERDGRGAGPE